MEAVDDDVVVSAKHSGTGSFALLGKPLWGNRHRSVFYFPRGRLRPWREGGARGQKGKKENNDVLLNLPRFLLFLAESAKYIDALHLKLG